MSDELTRAIADALGCDVTMDDEGGSYCSEHGEYLDHTGQCQEPERIAAALAPLIEARVREAEDERDEVAGRLSALLCDLTGGLLSKPGYDVPTMVQAVDAHYEQTVAGDAWEEGYDAAESKFPGSPRVPNPYRGDETDNG